MKVLLEIDGWKVEKSKLYEAGKFIGKVKGIKVSKSQVIIVYWTKIPDERTFGFDKHKGLYLSSLVLSTGIKTQKSKRGLLRLLSLVLPGKSR